MAASDIRPSACVQAVCKPRYGLSTADGLYQHFTWVDLSRIAGPRPP